MRDSSSSSAGLTREQTLYRNLVQQAASSGEPFMAAMVKAGIASLTQRADEAKELALRDRLTDAAQRLRRHQGTLGQAFTQALFSAFARARSDQRLLATAPAELHFDQLELMDSSQVHTSVVLARLQSAAADAVEVFQPELDALVCGLQKMRAVRPDANPLRPDAFVAALHSVVENADVGGGGQDDAVKAEWLLALGQGLGPELKTLFPRLLASLKSAGVVAAGYAARPNAVPAKPSRPTEEGALTVQRLRSLLAGELDGAAPANRVDRFAENFDRQFQDAATEPDDATTDFQSTIPHALEALTEMKQVEKVVEKLEQRDTRPPPASPAEVTLEAVRASLRARARNQAQVLSLEVVELMVDNIAQDTRLLGPVQSLVRSLEPPLLRLSLVDPRFFTDKQHPARLLLQEVTQQSLAFKAEQASGFTEFLNDIEHTLLPLQKAELSNADPFQEKLEALRQGWQARSAATAQDTADAVKVLQHAESRNLLAEKISREIETLPAALSAAPVVVNFLTGPWAQVIAQARLKLGAASPGASQYEGLVADLLWSVQRDLGRDGVNRLTRLVPRMIPVLREGLQSVDYPATKTSAFLESLMRLHQRAFRAEAARGDSILPGTEDGPLRWVEDGDPWVAPEEAKSSNFVGLEEDTRQAEEAAEPAPLMPDLDDALERLAQWDKSMVLGTWVEIRKTGDWQRLQLTWASPHGTLYLFTSPYGQTQSMTRRTIDRLVEADKLRLVATGSMVDGAMDAVAQAALRNSMQGGL